MKSCIYSGSFDPITYGHIDIINRACNTFDKVIVAIGVNPNKKYTFTVDERIAFIQKTVKQPIKVEVVSFDGLLADFAFERNVKTIIKGVRNNQDFDYERLLHEVTLTQQIGIDTHILIADQKLSHISSSAAKELCKYQGLIHEYVPYCVKHALEQKINNQVIIGITGAIGMGKSWVTEQLELLLTHRNSKVLHVDLDKIAHELYTRNEQVYVDLRNQIHSDFNLPNGFDRKVLGEIVFNDSDAMAHLNKLTRIPILTLVRKKMHGFQGIILLNGALLVEANFLPLCNNNIIVVNSLIGDQITSLKNRGLSVQQIQRRINSQMRNDEKVSKINDAINEHNFGNCIVYTNDHRKNEITSLLDMCYESMM
jgi:pantetheine-phosphate adenylyltransferase